MKCKIGAFLMLLAGAIMLLSACEGGNDTTVPIAVGALNNPVLVNYSTTVVANFSNYTSYVRSGSPITFTVSPDIASFSLVTQNTATFSNISSIRTRTAFTDANGRAWITVKSPLPGRFVITARSDLLHGTTFIGGTTKVSFIDQPALVQVRVGLRKPLAGVGFMNLDVISTLPPPAFVNFSGIQSPLIWNEDTAPNLPPGGTPDNGVTNLVIGSHQGINMIALKPLFRYDYVPMTPSVPNFALANGSAISADASHTPLFPEFYIISTKYFDAAGNELLY